MTVSRLLKMKEKVEKISMVTAYDYPTALLADEAGIDMILVGDSLGMVVLGYNNTVPVTVDDIVYHTKAVVRGAKSSFIVSDMPFMSYSISIEDAKRNAAKIIQFGGSDAVKLEGGKEVAPIIKSIVDMGIPVQAHIGLMPQRASVGGAYKVQAKDALTAMEMLEDALALEEAGAFSVVIEFVTAEAAEKITKNLKIPTIGIGAGPMCDGQVLLSHDLLGFYKKQPPFAKLYANLNETILRAFKDYKDDVKKQLYPSKKHSINMEIEESSKLKKIKN